MERSLRGFGNSTLLAIGSLYVVAAGLQETGALDTATSYVFGEEKSVRRLLLRMCPPITLYSGFLNKTAVVIGIVSAVGSGLMHLAVDWDGIIVIVAA